MSGFVVHLWLGGGVEWPRAAAMAFRFASEKGTRERERRKTARNGPIGRRAWFGKMGQGARILRHSGRCGEQEKRMSRMARLAEGRCQQTIFCNRAARVK